MIEIGNCIFLIYAQSELILFIHSLFNFDIEQKDTSVDIDYSVRFLDLSSHSIAEGNIPHNLFQYQVR